MTAKSFLRRLLAAIAAMLRDREPSPAPAPDRQPEAPPAPPAPAPVPADPADAIPAGEVTWAEADISAWPITATVLEAGVDLGRRRVTLRTTPKSWPQKSHPDGPGGMGNWWMIGNVGGRWHAATFEWLGVGRTQASWPEQFRAEETDPKRLRGKLVGWIPQRGETVGLCQSTYARDRVRTTNERSNIVTVSWP